MDLMSDTIKPNLQSLPVTLAASEWIIFNIRRLRAQKKLFPMLSISDGGLVTAVFLHGATAVGCPVCRPRKRTTTPIGTVN